MCASHEHVCRYTHVCAVGDGAHQVSCPILLFIPLVGSLTEPGARLADSKSQRSSCLSYPSPNRDLVVVMGEGCTRKSVPMPICPHGLSLFIWALGI